MRKLLFVILLAMVLAGASQNYAQETGTPITPQAQLSLEADSLEARRRAMREEQTMLDKRSIELQQEIADLKGRLKAATLELKSNRISQKDLARRGKELKIDTKQHKVEKSQAKRAAKDARRAEKEAEKANK